MTKEIYRACFVCLMYLIFNLFLGTLLLEILCFYFPFLFSLNSWFISSIMLLGIDYFIYFTFYKDRIHFEFNKISKDKYSTILKDFLCLFSISLFLTFVFTCLLNFFHLESITEIYTNTYSDLGVFGTIYGILVAPIIEEIIFRGCIYKKLSQVNVTLGIILSSLIFGLIHLNLVQLVTATIAGICLSTLYEKYHNLIIPILFHILNNLFASIVSGNVSINFLYILLLFIGCITFIYYLCHWNYKEILKSIQSIIKTPIFYILIFICCVVYYLEMKGMF